MNGNFVEVNNALTLMSGYPQESLTLSIRDLIHQESRDLELCLIG
jgi:PAS domain-containing protein